MKKYTNQCLVCAGSGLSFLFVALSVCLLVSCATSLPPPSEEGGDVRLLEGASSFLPSDVLGALELVEGAVGVSMALRMEEGVADVLHVEVSQRSKRPWDVGCVVKNDRAIREGDALLALCRLKAVAPLNEHADVRAGLSVYAGVPWKPIAACDVLGDTEARTFYLPFVASTNYAPGELVVSLQFGHQAQQLDVASVDLVRLGKRSAGASLSSPSMYSGRSAEASWRKAALDRIAKQRKGRLTLRILDVEGQPVSDAEVFLYLDRPSFRFGAFVSKQLVAVGGDQARRVYSDAISQTFNSITLEHGTHWGQWASGEGSALREETMDALKWAQHKGLRVRGGTLIYPGWGKQNPPGLQALSATALNKKIVRHVASIAGTLAPYVDSWDVISDARVARDMEKVLGEHASVAWFRGASKKGQGEKLFYSEFGLFSGDEGELDVVLSRVKRLKAKGAPIYGLGLSCIFNHDLPNPADVVKRLDKIAACGLKVEITEFAVALDDVQARADFSRDFLTAVYSHPAVEGLTFWGVWAGHGWKPQAALWDVDWRPTSQGVQVLRLLKDAWSAQRVGRSDEEGAFALSGPLGMYNLVVHAGGREIRRRIVLDASEVSVDVGLRDFAVVKRGEEVVVSPVVVATPEPKVEKVEVESLGEEDVVATNKSTSVVSNVLSVAVAVDVEVLEKVSSPAVADVVVALPVVEEAPKKVPEESVQEGIKKQMEKILPAKKDSEGEEVEAADRFDPFAPVRRR